jgi:hypothetical protein
MLLSLSLFMRDYLIFKFYHTLFVLTKKEIVYLSSLVLIVLHKKGRNGRKIQSLILTHNLRKSRNRIIVNASQPQKGNEVCNQFLVLKVIRVCDQTVDIFVAEKVICSKPSSESISSRKDMTHLLVYFFCTF